ncbi:hypothetical protein [Hymenobacter algoricola]|uniref:Uncharacterized protein n=1 Tax=Hymenobacter algoricola TaxID=486267 RepID=A0ABP7NTU5_9BACT
MDLALKIIGLLLTLMSVGAGIYNILTARTHQQDQKQRENVSSALALGNENKLEIKNLKERMDSYEDRTEKRLDQIGTDVADVKKLFTDFLLRLVPRS